MMNKKISLRHKLFFWFVVFSGVSVVLLWLMQTVFFDRVYAFYKEQVLKNQSAVVADNIDNPEIDSLIVNISQQNNISIYIVSQNGFIKSVSERSTMVRLNKASTSILDYWSLARSSDGLYVGRDTAAPLVGENGEKLDYDPSHFTGNVPKMAKHTNTVCARIVLLEDGEESMVVLMSNLEPIKSLTGVFTFIGVIITAIMVVVCFIGAVIVSRTISKPIEMLSHSTERLAEGDYGVVFRGGGCSEIVCLSDTLNHMKSELLRTEKLRREFFANVSHDLRTPLTMISGYGKMMQEIPGEDNAENLQIIVDEAERLTKLVNGILDLTRLQSGTYDLHRTTFSLTESASELADEFSRLFSGKADIEFTSKREIFVNADETLVSSALYNLINNAITHSGDGAKIRIIQTAENGKVRITVKDNGPGIEESELSGIWDRYRKRSGSGTGLGLAIVKAAMELNHGGYGVFSKVGEGSCFWIELNEE